MAGRMEEKTNRDHIFFLHAFLPAFAPWSVLAYVSLFDRIRSLSKRTHEWATSGTILVVLIVVSLSGYQLPHYLNVVFPTAAIMVASFIIEKQFSRKWTQVIVIIQSIIIFLALIAIAVLNAWSFPVRQTWIIIVLILLLSAVFYFLKSKMYSSLQKAVLVSAATMVFAFFLLNANFYPQLLKYQGGNELAFATMNRVDTSRLFFWKNTYSSSFNFYSRSLRKPFSDSVIAINKATWLIYDIRDTAEVRNAGYLMKGETYTAIDYEVTMLDIKFLDPKKRDQQCTKMLLSEIIHTGN
jgi:hypothetical protein